MPVTISESDIQKKRFAEMHNGNHNTGKRKAKQTKYHDVLSSSSGKDHHKERHYENLKSGADESIKSLEETLNQATKQRRKTLSHKVKKADQGESATKTKLTKKRNSQLNNSGSITPKRISPLTSPSKNTSGTPNKSRFAKLVRKHNAVSRVQRLAKMVDGGLESLSKMKILTNEEQESPTSNQFTPSASRSNLNTPLSSAVDPLSLVSKEGKKEYIQELGKRRNERMLETQKRRNMLEKERIRRFQQNSGTKRQQRLKKRSADAKLRLEIARQWLFCVALGSRIGLTLKTIRDFRTQKHQISLENSSALIITRQMRLFRFRSYRKRVQSAFYILGSILVLKVRVWKQVRRNIAGDKIRAFLISLETENLNSGGCLALIVKGKKWRAYRQKIVVLQRLWREKMRIMSAQVLLIDQQWIRKQDARTQAEVDRIYVKGEAVATAQNEANEVKNRTRRLIKLKALPKKKWESRAEIRYRLEKGRDLLSEGNIVPEEIRHGIIRHMLMCMRKIFLKETEQYLVKKKTYEEELKSFQRRRALLVGFSGNGVATAFTQGYLESQVSVKMGEHASIAKCPTKPYFHLILGEKALRKLITLGNRHVNDIRHAWKPETMFLNDIYYNGKEAAECHYEECGGLQ